MTHFTGKTYPLTQEAFNKVVRELEEAKKQVAIMKEALKRIERGTHEAYPACMAISPTNFGPPRTNGWEGWAYELRQANIDIAREALQAVGLEK